MSTSAAERAVWPAPLEIGNPSALSPLDIATSRMLGAEGREPLPGVSSDVSLDETLGDILEPAVASGRCLVSFSGGRESAWLLAAATAAARRRGHPDPIPATLRYPGVAPDREAAHQERIVAHLRLADWERVDIQDELEILGPYACRAIADVGLVFPATSYALLPLLDIARDGWLVIGGSLTDFFTYWRWARLWDALTGRRRPRRRDVRDLGVAVVPRRVREALLRPRIGQQPSWLREDAARDVERLLLDTATQVPLGFDAAARRQRIQRCNTGMRRSFEALAASAGARVSMPFRDDRYIAALVATGGRRGFGDRASTLLHLAGHLLPPELLRRSDGVNSRQAYFGDASRAFAERWTGHGLDTDLVDVDVLRTMWSAGSFPWPSTMLFQLAFAHDQARSSGGRDTEGMKKVRPALTTRRGTGQSEASTSGGLHEA